MCVALKVASEDSFETEPSPHVQFAHEALLTFRYMSEILNWIVIGAWPDVTFEVKAAMPGTAVMVCEIVFDPNAPVTISQIV